MWTIFFLQKSYFRLSWSFFFFRFSNFSYSLSSQQLFRFLENFPRFWNFRSTIKGEIAPSTSFDLQVSFSRLIYSIKVFSEYVIVVLFPLLIAFVLSILFCKVRTFWHNTLFVFFSLFHEKYRFQIFLFTVIFVLLSTGFSHDQWTYKGYSYQKHEIYIHICIYIYIYIYKYI